MKYNFIFQSLYTIIPYTICQFISILSLDYLLNKRGKKIGENTNDEKRALK